MLALNAVRVEVSKMSCQLFWACIILTKPFIARALHDRGSARVITKANKYVCNPLHKDVCFKYLKELKQKNLQQQNDNFKMHSRAATTFWLFHHTLLHHLLTLTLLALIKAKTEPWYSQRSVSYDFCDGLYIFKTLPVLEGIYSVCMRSIIEKERWQKVRDRERTGLC